MKKKPKPQDLIKEIAIFSIGVGIILGAVAYLTLTNLKNAPDFCGIQRNLALGIPLDSLGVLL